LIQESIRRRRSLGAALENPSSMRGGLRMTPVVLAGHRDEPCQY
jgi:hypothetical protein